MVSSVVHAGLVDKAAEEAIVAEAAFGAEAEWAWRRVTSRLETALELAAKVFVQA